MKNAVRLSPLLNMAINQKPAIIELVRISLLRQEHLLFEDVPGHVLETKHSEK
jgi:hypothetical protein